MTEESQKLLTLVLACIGTVSGIVGTSLGAVSLWRQHDRDKVKLGLVWTVEPFGGRLGPAVMAQSLKIENQSAFAVTITDVGIVFAKRGGPTVSFSQTIVDGEDTLTRALPIRIESHDAITLTSDGDNRDSVFQEFGVHHLYVKTGGGAITKLFSPSSPAA